MQRLKRYALNAFNAFNVSLCVYLALIKNVALQENYFKTIPIKKVDEMNQKHFEEKNRENYF